MGKCQQKNVWLFVHNVLMVGFPGTPPDMSTEQLLDLTQLSLFTTSALSDMREAWTQRKILSERARIAFLVQIGGIEPEQLH